MDIEQVLEKLESLGVKEKFFKITTLGELPHSCVPDSKLPVIDYDKTASTLYDKMKSLSKPQSCDALKINSQNYDFIELKSLKNLFLHRYKENRDAFLKKDFSEKFTGSLKIFDNLLDVVKFKFTKEEKSSLKNLVRYYFVLVDYEFDYNNGSCENNEEFYTRMSFLSAGYVDNIICNKEDSVPSDIEKNQFYEEFSAALDNQFITCKTHLPNIQTKLITPNQLNDFYNLNS